VVTVAAPTGAAKARAAAKTANPTVLRMVTLSPLYGVFGFDLVGQKDIKLKN